MKAMLLLLALSIVALPSASLGAETIQDQLNGTWSGSWIPDGGTGDSMTIELRYDDNGKLTGRFVSPVSMDFSAATFNAKTRMLSLEASDPKSGKQYKLNAKVEGTEIKGAVTVDKVGGRIQLIKWTFVPRMTGF